MVGSVLHQEMLLGGRRGRGYVLRWIYAGWLILQVLGFYAAFLILDAGRGNALRSAGDSAARNQASAPGVVGGWFAETFVFQQMILLLMVTPAFVAGAITDEKRRGTLQMLLTADLDTRHIVFGKLFGRLAQVFLLMLSGMPLFFLMAGFGGVEPATLVVTGVTLLAPTFAISAATLLASVLCKQTRDAVILLYVLGLVGYVTVTLVGGPLEYLNPLFVLGPAWGPFNDIDWSNLMWRLGIEALAWGAIGGACVALAVWQLRPVYIRELESSPAKKPRWLAVERQPVGDDPVRWRERYVESLTPTVFRVFLLAFLPLWIVPFLIVRFTAPAAGVATRRLSQWPGVALVAVLTIASSLAILWTCLPPGTTFAGFVQAALHFNIHKLQAMTPVGAEEGFLVQGLVVMVLFSMIVGIRCSGSITSEREKQTWEAVLLTPMSAKQLVNSKLWGVLTGMLWFLAAYAAPALLLSSLGGLGALFWTVLWLAVTVLAMYFLGAAGLWCSAWSKSSGRSLMWTMAISYLGGFGLYIVTSPAVFILALLFILVLFLLDRVFNTQWSMMAAGAFGAWWPAVYAASCVTLGAIFFFMSRFFLGWTQRWIADRERTRHWHEEPVYRRARRPEYARARYAP
jgi:ABC-type transport system involved in multi-copper enzyme maturation permease subunit